MNPKKIERDFRKFIEKRQGRITGVPGVIGNREGIAKVASRPHHVYVQVIGRGLMEVYNKKVSEAAGTPVYVGYDPLEPNLVQVLSTRSISRYGEDDIDDSSVPYHHQQHEWMAHGPGGGEDVTFIQLRQFMPLRVGPGGGLEIAIHRGVVYANGVWQLVNPTANLDMSGYVPATLEAAAWVLVTVDTAGAIVTTKGVEKQWLVLALEDIPAEPSGTACSIAAIRLYNGQTEIAESRTNTDIVDLRFPQRSGTGQNSDNATATGSGIVIDSLAAEVVVDATSGTVVYN